MKKLPQPAAPLNKAERQFYDSIGKAVVELGKFEESDRFALTLLAQQCALAHDQRLALARHGYVTETAAGGLKSNPMVKQLADTTASITRLLMQFGLTPASRQRAAPAGVPPEHDPLSEFLPS
jgi:P27 family predicted phage terminase small subunit